MPIKKEKLSPTSKARKEASRNEFTEKSGVPDTVKNFGEVNSSKNCARARLGFVKPIRNGLRKIKKLIKSRPYRDEAGMVGRKNRARFQKEE